MRMKILLVAALAAVPLVLSAGAAQASCADADQCTAQQCSQRQALVHPRCDVSRSCATIAATEANRHNLQQRLQRNQQCLNARQNVNQCFSMPDQGHQTAINQVQAALDACQAKIDAIP